MDFKSVRCIYITWKIPPIHNTKHKSWTGSFDKTVHCLMQPCGDFSKHCIFFILLCLFLIFDNIFVLLSIFLFSLPLLSPVYRMQVVTGSLLSPYNYHFIRCSLASCPPSYHSFSWQSTGQHSPLWASPLRGEPICIFNNILKKAILKYCSQLFSIESIVFHLTKITIQLRNSLSYFLLCEASGEHRSYIKRYFWSPNNESFDGKKHD